MPHVNGGDAIVQTLAQEQVSVVFDTAMADAGSLAAAVDASGAGIRRISARNAVGAAYMADAYARVTGRVGIVLLGPGAGIANALSGLAASYRDGISVVYIALQVHSREVGLRSYQELDIAAAVRGVTKHQFRARKHQDLPVLLMRAVQLARSRCPGPVVVEIPQELTDPNETVDIHPASDEQALSQGYRPIGAGSPRAVRRSCDVIEKAESPVLLVGGGVVTSNASAQITYLAEQMEMPIVTTMMGLGGVSAEHPLTLGMAGLHGSVPANLAVHHSDMILAFGTRFDTALTNDPTQFAPQAKIVHVDADPSNIGRTIEPNEPIIGDAKTVAAEIARALMQRGYMHPGTGRLQPWWRHIRRWRTRYVRHAQGQSKARETERIHPEYVMQTIHRMTEGEAVLTSDIGRTQLWAAQHHPFANPRRWLTSGGFAAIGYGVPAAIAARVAEPDRDVVCVTGEGALAMSAMEIGTCREYDLKIVIVCLNNGTQGYTIPRAHGGGGAIRANAAYSKSLPDFGHVMSAYGLTARTARSASEFDDAMQAALESSETSLVNVHIDGDVGVYPAQISPHGSMRDMWIDQFRRT